MVLLGAAFGVLCVIDGDLRQDRSRWCGFRLCYAKRYQLSAHLNPFYLHGDFDGDGRSDSALRIKERSSGKNGIAIYHGKSNRSAPSARGRTGVTAATTFQGWTRGMFFTVDRLAEVRSVKFRRNCAVTRCW